MQRFVKALDVQNLVTPSKAAAAGVGVVITPLLDELMTGGKGWLFLLLLSIIVGDWISGSAAAKKDRTYASEYGTAGIFRTLLILWMPFIGILLDVAMTQAFKIETPGFAFYAITVALIYHNWESMTANVYRAGWGKWIPKTVLDFISSELKNKALRAKSRQKEAVADVVPIERDPNIPN